MTLIRIPNWKLSGTNPAISGTEATSPRDITLDANNALMGSLDSANVNYTVVQNALGIPAATSTTISSSTTGTVRALTRLLGSGSTLSLITGSNAVFQISGLNLTVNGQIGLGERKGIIQEALGEQKIQYPLTYLGVNQTVAPHPAPTEPAKSRTVDFATYADNTILASQPGWMPCNDGSLNPPAAMAASNIRIMGGALKAIAGGGGYYKPANSIVCDLGTKDQTVVLENVNLDPDGDNQQNAWINLVLGSGPIDMIGFM